MQFKMSTHPIPIVIPDPPPSVAMTTCTVLDMMGEGVLVRYRNMGWGPTGGFVYIFSLSHIPGSPQEIPVYQFLTHQPPQEHPSVGVWLAGIDRCLFWS